MINARKKVLLGTTALVSAGLVAQNAQAADPIELSVGGYHNWAFFFTDTDDGAGTDGLPAEPGFQLGDHDLKFDGEVQLRGSTVLDNGLEVGVRIEIEGETNGDQFDENYAWIEGSFGTFRFGNDDPAAAQMATAAPYLNYVFGANSPSVYTNGLSQFFARGDVDGTLHDGTREVEVMRTAAPVEVTAYLVDMDGNVQVDDAGDPIERQVVVHEDVTETVTEDVEGTVRSRFAAGAGATFTTFSSQTGDDATLLYFTPVFNGFQFGVSYAPNNSEARPGDVYLLPNEAATDHGEVYSVGGRYDGSVGDLGVTVAAGWYSAENKVDSNDGLALDTASAWDAGLVLYWDNWSLGGSYNQIDNLRNVSDTDQATYDIGLAYSSDGAWSAGIYWLNSEIDYAAGTLVPVAVTDEMDSYRFMVSYDLGPSVGVTGTVGYDEFQDGVTDRNYETQFVGAGIMIGF